MGQTSEEAGVRARSTLFRNKYRRTQVVLLVDKNRFELTDVLSRHIGFPTFESFLEEQVGLLLEQYLMRARSVIEGAGVEGRARARSAS